MDFSVGIEQHYGQESQYFTTNTVTSSRDMRQDLVDKVMSVDGILHVFDMSKLAINITKGEKIANSEFTKTRTACTGMYCFVHSLLLYTTQMILYELF